MPPSVASQPSPHFHSEARCETAKNLRLSLGGMTAVSPVRNKIATKFDNAQTSLTSFDKKLRPETSSRLEKEHTHGNANGIDTSTE
jgi:hypothetical protein